MSLLQALPVAAAEAIEPKCRYFGTCGGCSLQHVSYPGQLQLKQERLQALFSGIEGMQRLFVAGADAAWRYRNKAEFSFGVAEGRIVLGFHAARSFRRVVDLEDCLLMPEAAMDLLRKLCALAQQSGFAVYHPRTHQGFFRFAILRASHSRGKLMLCLVTASADSAQAAWVSQASSSLMAQCAALESVYWAKTDQMADAAAPEQMDLIAGCEWLEDALGPFKIKLHPLTFIQSHSSQAHRLYEAAVASLGTGESQTAWDLYCGAGLISLYLSRRFKTVYGIDSEAHHLNLAAQNAAMNGINNIRWVTGKAEEALKDRRFWLTEARPDVVVIDPPRTGLHISVLSALLAARPKQIAYVSCNPESLARDLQVFSKSFPVYRVARAQAFDLFPQTNHVETLAVLER